MATEVWHLTSGATGERRKQRRAVAVGAARTQPGDGAADARLLDLSIYGCRLAVDYWHDEGDRLWLRFDGGWPIAASIVWSDGGRVGCRFDQPIAQSLMRELTRALC